MPDVLCAGRRYSVALAMLAAWLALQPIASRELQANRPGAVPVERNCFYQLDRGRGSDIVCDHPALLTDQERTELRRYTRDLVQDASCLVSVRIDRRLVEAAIAAAEHEFKAPPQRVICTVHTRDSAMPITGTFAPRVLIKDGRAVEATPGLADVQGVHAALAWPVVEFVNRSATIRDGMLSMINGYLERRRQPAGRRG